MTFKNRMNNILQDHNLNEEGRHGAYKSQLTLESAVKMIKYAANTAKDPQLIFKIWRNLHDRPTAFTMMDLHHHIKEELVWAGNHPLVANENKHREALEELAEYKYVYVPSAGEKEND
jgi:hypothetical protein